MTPRSSVFVCGVPRSGTWLVAHLLRSTGAVGYPAEWFWKDDVRRNWTEWRVAGWHEYVERVLAAGTSRVGVFGCKLMWGYLEETLFQLRRLRGEYDADDATVLEAVFPEPRYVWVVREDTVAQAVSWAKAAQTGRFAAHQSAVAEPEFDFEQIDSLHHLVRVHNGAWRRWFERHEIEPIRIAYEHVVSDLRGTTLEVLDRLGLEPLPAAQIEPPPELTKQADETNADWAARYRELARG